MKRKLIFFDIDGTLLDHNKKVPNSTKETVKKLKQQGHHIAISTGRAPFMFKKLREELDIDSFVSFNGQLVVYEGMKIYENPFKIETLKNLLQYAHKSNHPLVFMSEEDMKASVESHPYIHDSMGSLKFEHPEYHPEYFQEKNIYQTLLFCKNGEEDLYKHYEELRFVRWHPYSTDILPVGGSKAEGIKKLLDQTTFDIEDVVAFGDGLNDIEMIQFANIGVAMGNAVEELKEIADFVTKSVDEDGIKHAADELGLL